MQTIRAPYPAYKKLITITAQNAAHPSLQASLHYDHPLTLSQLLIIEDRVSTCYHLYISFFFSKTQPSKEERLKPAIKGDIKIKILLANDRKQFKKIGGRSDEYGVTVDANHGTTWHSLVVVYQIHRDDLDQWTIPFLKHETGHGLTCHLLGKHKCHTMLSFSEGLAEVLSGKDPIVSLTRLDCNTFLNLKEIFKMNKTTDEESHLAVAYLLKEDYAIFCAIATLIQNDNEKEAERLLIQWAEKQQTDFERWLQDKVLKLHYPQQTSMLIALQPAYIRPIANITLHYNRVTEAHIEAIQLKLKATYHRVLQCCHTLHIPPKESNQDDIDIRLYFSEDNSTAKKQHPSRNKASKSSHSLFVQTSMGTYYNCYIDAMHKVEYLFTQTLMFYFFGKQVFDNISVTFGAGLVGVLSHEKESFSYKTECLERLGYLPQLRVIFKKDDELEVARAIGHLIVAYLLENPYEQFCEIAKAIEESRLKTIENLLVQFAKERQMDFESWLAILGQQTDPPASLKDNESQSASLPCLTPWHEAIECHQESTQRCNTHPIVDTKSYSNIQKIPLSNGKHPKHNPHPSTATKHNIDKTKARFLGWISSTPLSNQRSSSTHRKTG